MEENFNAVIDGKLGEQLKELFKNNKAVPVEKPTKSKTTKSVGKDEKEMNKEVKEMEVKEMNKEVKEMEIKEEVKEEVNGANTGAKDYSYSKFTTRILDDNRVAILSRNLAMACAYLTSQRFSCVKNEDDKTKDKFKNIFIFENTASLQEAVELIESNKKKLRAEERAKRK